MTKRQTWIDQLNRYVFPLVVVGIGMYGTWDLIIQPLSKVQPPTNTCTTLLVNVTVLKPSSQPGQPPKKIQAPKGLPIVVPAGEKRIFLASVENPDEKSVIYQWRSTYGQFESRVTMEPQSIYTAPRSLVNDTITLEASVQGCAPAKRTIEIAVVPSANVPLSEQPFTPDPLATPTAPTTLPTIDPFAEPPKNTKNTNRQ
ncbi:hypothetical protein OsccyDRAFT_1661 [Leptolyngbyaceae cyanobacterium JSC-12]|nr:hypothetical protein OsccyDRAFT_1661 [Leptolyngbyaceae cyanobacterium JSC-12]